MSSEKRETFFSSVICPQLYAISAASFLLTNYLMLVMNLCVVLMELSEIPTALFHSQIVGFFSGSSSHI